MQHANAEHCATEEENNSSLCEYAFVGILHCYIINCTIHSTRAPDGGMLLYKRIEDRYSMYTNFLENHPLVSLTVKVKISILDELNSLAFNSEIYRAAG